jgi:hypothetical protein
MGIWLLTLSMAWAQQGPPREPPTAGGDPTSAFILSNGAAGIPANGALLFEGPYDSPLTVTVHVSGTFSPLAGQLTAVPDSPFWIWQPAQQLPLGGLIAETSSTDGLVSPLMIELQVVPAIELAQPELMFTPSASLISVISSKACCRSRLNGSATLVESMQCFGAESRASIQVDPGVFTSTGQLQANQYLFRFSTGANQRTTFTNGSFRSVVLPVFREQAGEYCFAVSAIELPTLRELTYDEPSTCAAHGDLEALGPKPLEPSTAELSRVLCPAPPAGFEDAWCDANEDCSAEEASCGLYPHFCEGEPLEPLSPDASLPTGDGDGGDGDGGGDEDAPMKSGSGGGCSTATGRPVARGSGAVGLAGALSALVGARSRRRQSEPRCAKPAAC